MKTLNLVVPGLCGPLPGLELLKISDSLLSLGKILSRADRFQCAHQGFYPELAALFGYRPAAGVPSAALSLVGHGHDLGDGHWFHADPVFLQADMDHAILRDSSNINLQKHEADALADEINRHFAVDGIRVVAVDAEHWFLNIHDHAAIETTPLHDVIGSNVKFHMPRGNDAAFWKRFMNEVQMLFHMSEVNQQREQSDLLPINSVWVWGGGLLPDVVNECNHNVFADNLVAKGLARLHNSNHQAVENIDSLLEEINEKESFIAVFDDIFKPASYGDIAAWQEAVELIFETRIQPLVIEAMRKKIALRLFPCNGVNYLVLPSHRYRFYRRGDLRKHISTHVTS